MELIKIAWIVVFLFFSLTLLFVWSKMYILSKKIKIISTLISQVEEIDGKQPPETGTAEQ
jgi:cell division protein FtsL